jgi:hypothetical protein
MACAARSISIEVVETEEFVLATKIYIIAGDSGD